MANTRGDSASTSGALQKNEVSLLPYLNVSEKDLEFGFQNYLKNIAQRSSRNVVKVSGEDSDVSIQSIPDTEAQMSIAEIFLANGKLPEARRHLEILAAQAPDSTRVSYYRGILARISSDASARDFFVDALPGSVSGSTGRSSAGANGRHADSGGANDPGGSGSDAHSNAGSVSRAREYLRGGAFVESKKPSA
jgi:hypothetical protein